MRPIGRVGYKVLMAVTLTLFVTVLASAQEAKPIDLSKTETGEALPANNPNTLVGTWIVQSTVTNCSGTTLQMFSKLVSINAGGTAQETSTGLAPSLRTPGLGNWRHVSQNMFEYGLAFFRFNPDGTFASTTIARWSLTVGQLGTSYAADGQIQVVLPNGTVAASLCGTEVGTRFE